MLLKAYGSDRAGQSRIPGSCDHSRYNEKIAKYQTGISPHARPFFSSAAYRRKDRDIVSSILIVARERKYVKKIMKISIKYKRAILPDTFKRLAVRASAPCENSYAYCF